MKRSLTIALALLTSVAQAQPAERAPTPKARPAKARPAKAKPAAPQAPVDPYADPAPTDPYADPVAAPAVTPAVTPGRPNPKAKPGKGPPTRPVDPYADPLVAPPGTLPKLGQDRPVEPALGPRPEVVPARIGIADVAAVQGLLAVQRLDGWLLFDRAGENPIAARLVQPEGKPARAWFYLVPARGQPIALVHASEQRSFEHLAGRKLVYAGYRDLDKQLRTMLKGLRTVAVEYSAKAAVPSVSRIDAGTIERIRAAGVQVKSSATLVQFTKAIWGDAGRTLHHIAVHHLVELRKDALAFVASAIRSGQPVTEYDVQQRLLRGMTVRGLASVPPIVAAGINTADPYYVPTAARTSPIARGDLLVLTIALKVDKPEGVWAKQTWIAVVDQRVPEPITTLFETASLARDSALALISARSRKRRPVTGAEVDDAVRAFLSKAGHADKVLHRTGHSIDNDLQGGGADLDNFEVKDTRILTPGTGFTVGPGVYLPGQMGVRAEVSVYLSPTGPEVTTPAQDFVEAILAR